MLTPPRDMFSRMIEERFIGMSSLGVAGFLTIELPATTKEGVCLIHVKWVWV